jgi:hypothetical protein
LIANKITILTIFVFARLRRVRRRNKNGKEIDVCLNIFVGGVSNLYRNSQGGCAAQNQL